LAALSDALHRPEQPGWGDTSKVTRSRRPFVSSTSAFKAEVKKSVRDVALTTPS